MQMTVHYNDDFECGIYFFRFEQDSLFTRFVGYIIHEDGPNGGVWFYDEHLNDIAAGWTLNESVCVFSSIRVKS